MTSKITVIIPSLNSAARIMPTLACLITPMADGLIKKVIFADGGSTDITADIAEETGAAFVSTPKGRGMQCKIGVIFAIQSDWLLFLHDDSQLSNDWGNEVASFVHNPSNINKCAYFKLALDDRSIKAKIVAWGANMRCKIFALPYGDQGLLISRKLYEEIGGFGTMPLMEDVDIIERIKTKIGKQNLVMLRAVLTTSADKYKHGYAKRVWRNFKYLRAYKNGTDPKEIAESYYK
ncbi:MAG: TIGR04283 family arsenosugar biosynthesis glycosyltransferase [Alphaproteobacteria bacterium]|nr:TIGR04283 family arsenosugar biosynthesis glycosyltransferase [Alphaproteobacteria bacterium]